METKNICRLKKCINIIVTIHNNSVVVINFCCKLTYLYIYKELIKQSWKVRLELHRTKNIQKLRM